MKPEILNAVSEYLFPKKPGQDLFKSLYNVLPCGDYKGRAKELLELSVEVIPKYAHQNTTFSYSMATKLLPRFEEYIAYDEQQQNSAKGKNIKQPTKSPQEVLEQAIQDTKEQLGISDDIDGMKHQDELLGEIEQQGEDKVWAIQSTKNPDAECIAEQIKRVAASVKSVQESIKNISAVSDSLLRGIEKVKSAYSEFGFDYGRNLQQIDPSELAYLHGDARQLFLLKYAKGELLEESSQDKKGLGDLIIAVDTSGSTCTPATNGMNILDLEMGIALTLAKIATKHKCRVRICLHHTKIHGDSDWVKGKELVNRYFGSIYTSGKCVASGDNDFDVILGNICEWMEGRQYPSQRKPGIVFITDGHDTLDKSTLYRVTNLRSNQGIKLFSYFVARHDPRDHAKELISVSSQSYWIDAKKPIDKQIDAFLDVSK